MKKLNTNIIYDSSPVTERLIKFSMFYFDEVNLHFPEVCVTTLKDIPTSILECKDFLASNKKIPAVLEIFDLYNKTDFDKYNQLSFSTNLKISEFFDSKLILDSIKIIPNIPNEHYDYIILRSQTLNLNRDESLIMKIIGKNISSQIFNNFLIETVDGFIIKRDEIEKLHIDNDTAKIFENAFNKDIIEYLYQCNGECIYTYDYLKKYEWFKLYYSTLLSYIINVLSNAENMIITDNFLSDMLEEINILTCVQYKKQSALKNKISQILLPDFFDLEYEDIYELKEYANDELMAFKYYVNSLGKIESQEELEQIIQTKVNPSVNELKNKIKNMKINLTQKAIREIKNPFSYLPLLSSLVTDIDQTLAAAISLGVMGADLALEYYKEKQNIKNHPLFFTVKLNKKINKLR